MPQRGEWIAQELVIAIIRWFWDSLIVFCFWILFQCFVFWNSQVYFQSDVMWFRFWTQREHKYHTRKQRHDHWATDFTSNDNMAMTTRWLFLSFIDFVNFMALRYWLERYLIPMTICTKRYLIPMTICKNLRLI